MSLTRPSLVAAPLLVVVVLAAACSSSGGHASPRPGRRSSTAPTSTSTPSERSTTTTAHGAAPASKANRAGTDALRAHMVDAIDGYALQPAGTSGTGPSTLASAAVDAGGGAGPDGAAERGALTKAGFEAGYKLLFTAPSDREVLALAYRFATPAGAQQYAQHAYATRVHDSGTAPTTALPGIPGSKVVDRSESDASAALVFFTRGQNLVILSTIQPPGASATALLEPIATEQYQRLAGY